MRRSQLLPLHFSAFWCIIFLSSSIKSSEHASSYIVVLARHRLYFGRASIFDWFGSCIRISRHSSGVDRRTMWFAAVILLLLPFLIDLREPFRPQSVRDQRSGDDQGHENFVLVSIYSTEDPVRNLQITKKAQVGVC